MPSDIRQACIKIVLQDHPFPPPEARLDPSSFTRQGKRANKQPPLDPAKSRWQEIWSPWTVDTTKLIPIIATFRKETKELRERLNIEHPSPPQARNSTNTNMSSQGDKDRDDPPGETPRRLNNLENMMTTLMAKIDKLAASTGNQTEKETESSGRQGTSQPLPLANKVEVTRKIKPEDIGYFNPDNTADTSEDKGKTVVYRNIYEFIDRIEITVLQWGENEVKAVLNSCYRGSAQYWFTSLLTKDQRTLYYRSSTQEMKEVLINKFKMRTVKAVRECQSAHFGFQEVRKGESVDVFAAALINTVKAAEINDPYLQVLTIYNALDLDLRRDLQEPGKETTLDSFIKILNERKDIWEQLAHRARPPPNPKPANLQGTGGSNLRPRQYPYQPTTYRFNHRLYDPQYNTTQPQTGVPNNTFQQPPPSIPSQSYQQQNNANQQYSRPSGYSPRPNPPPGTTAPPIRPYQGFPNRPSNGFQPRTDNSANQRLPPRLPQPAAYYGQEGQAERKEGSDQLEEATEQVNQPQMESNYTYEGEDPYYGSTYDNPDESYGYFATPSVTNKPEPFACNVCGQTFVSKNKLHIHLGNRGQGRNYAKNSCLGRSVMHALSKQAESEAIAKQKDMIQPEQTPQKHAEAYAQEESSTERVIIESNTDSATDVGTGQAFRNYRYCRIGLKMSPEAQETKICADSGCGITLADRQFITNTIPNVAIRKMATPAEVSGLGGVKHQTADYVIASLFFDGVDEQGKPVIAKTAPRELHLVEGLGAKVLLGVDIMHPEGIDLLASRKTAHISSCKVDIPIEVFAKGPLIKRVVCAKTGTTLPPHSIATVTVHHLDLPDRDFFFEPEDTKLSIYAGIANSELTSVLVKNDTEHAMRIHRICG